ncbi:MAG: hypothetical protein HYX42_11210 [Polaromonas sp.]|uniref:hypothetical protein n=1 Tax=Polaromonas sp. TaxID=1869339 RepID=UPI0025D59BF6|nr:hypothetical protein [Polaromonas sp.]MBI2726807.1 hypothetical protein [Polaromonas sp.]
MAQAHTPPPRHSTIARLHRIKKWHVNHKEDHPLEYQIWDVMLTFWVMGWIAWVPAMALDAPWAYPLCIAGVCLPGLYMRLRLRAHESLRLRCDWVDEIR